MTARSLLVSVFISAVVSAGANLAVRWVIDRRLTTGDYVASAIIGVAAGLAVFLLFRKWTGCC